MQIIRKGDTISVPGYGTYSRPTLADKRHADMIRREQEQLYNEFCRLPPTEEGQGRGLSIVRKIKTLELRKHPLLRVWMEHLELWK